MKKYPIRVAQIMGKMENGGVEAVVMNYYRHIDRTKMQFDFIVDNDSSCPQEEEIISLGGRVIRVAPYQSIIANMRDLKKVFTENHYKIVHSELTTMSIFSLAVAKKCGIPVRICHGHNTACKGETKKNIMKYMLRPFSKIFATHYFACSDYAGKWLFGKDIDKNKRYKIIRNAIDINKFRFNSEIRDEVRKELDIEDKFVVGHIGRFVYQKNHDFLIDIFNEVHKKNSNSVLLLVGEGPLVDEVKQKVHRLGLDSAVRFLGVRQDADRLYQAFDVFLLPSRYEGLPVVGVEAQISGVPCVFSNDMTAETKFTDSLQFLDLAQSVNKWASIVSDKIHFDRKENKKEINRFDICSEAKRLGEVYEKLYKWSIDKYNHTGI